MALYKQAKTGTVYATKNGFMHFEETAEIVEEILIRVGRILVNVAELYRII